MNEDTPCTYPDRRQHQHVPLDLPDRLRQHGPQGHRRRIFAQLRFRLRELCQRAIELIILDMPLADPHSADLCPEIEALGFFFCGIIPEKRQGDVIRFEYLNNVQIDLSQVIVVSDFGRELLAYIADSAGLPRT